jgi:hypothetical protein
MVVNDSWLHLLVPMWHSMSTSLCLFFFSSHGILIIAWAMDGKTDNGAMATFGLCWCG